MDIKSFLASLGDKKEELVKKALQCQNAEGLLALAKESGVALDESTATKLFAAMHINSGKLTDDELDSVAGGANDKPNGKPDNFRCDDCGHQFYNPFNRTGLRNGAPIYERSTCPKCNSWRICNFADR